MAQNRPRITASLVLFLLAGANPISADSPRTFTLGWADVGWAVLGGASVMGAQIRYDDMRPAEARDLVRSDLIFMDRWAAGLYSPGADLASDMLAFPLCALPVAWSAWKTWGGKPAPGQRASTGIPAPIVDAVILAEAMALSSSLNLFVRSLRIHPRPLVYGQAAPRSEREKGEASGSFYSGHASAAFLAATYFAYTYPLRHPEFKYHGALWAGALGAASLVAGLRVAAGKHFPSDVLVGAAAGAFFGWVFPRMHLKTPGGGTAALRLDAGPEGARPRVEWTF